MEEKILAALKKEQAGMAMQLRENHMVLTAARLTDSASAAAFIADNLAQQAALREGYQAKQTPQVASLDEARKNKLNLFPEA